MSISVAHARRRLIIHSAVVAGLIFAGYLFIVAAAQKGSLAFDVVAYWSVDLAELYRGREGELGFFPYTPAIALMLAPFAQLPWPVFVAGWYALLGATLLFLGRRHVLLLLAFPPVAIELYHGNIHLLLAAAMVLGFRHPAAWALVLLTKITPGVALLWFVARREWHSLAVALGATAAIVSVTAVALPGQWLAWLAMLIREAGTELAWPALPIPIWLRLPVAAAVVWWGARRDAYWTVPVAGMLGLPALWPGGFAMLAACLPLWLRARSAASSAMAAAAVGSTAGGYHAPDASDTLRRGSGSDTRPATA